MYTNKSAGPYTVTFRAGISQQAAFWERLSNAAGYEVGRNTQHTVCKPEMALIIELGSQLCVDIRVETPKRERHCCANANDEVYWKEQPAALRTEMALELGRASSSPIHTFFQQAQNN